METEKTEDIIVDTDAPIEETSVTAMELVMPAKEEKVETIATTKTSNNKRLLFTSLHCFLVDR
jgi:hypothetical protein